MVSKKGLAIPQLLIAIVFMVVIAIAATQAYPLFTDLNEDIQNSDDMNPVSKNVSAQSKASYPGTMDYAFATFLVFMLILNVVFSYMSSDKPFLLVLLYIVLIAIIVVAGLLSNAWEDYTDDPSVELETSFPIMNWALDNFMLVFAVFGFISLIVIFMRERLT